VTAAKFAVNLGTAPGRRTEDEMKFLAFWTLRDGNGQLHTPANIYPGKEPLVTIGEEVGWTWW